MFAILPTKHVDFHLEMELQSAWNGLGREFEFTVLLRLANNSGVSQAVQHGSSAGPSLSAPGWWDFLFEACEPQYSALLHAAGFSPGSRILDAGCGSGSFTPL